MPSTSGTGFSSVSVSNYLEQAGHNRRVADVLSQGSPVSLQWAVTCIFYTALHYVNAYLYHLSQHQMPATHGAREHRVSQDMGQVYRSYRWLKSTSERARYSLVWPTAQIFETSCQKVGEIQLFVEDRLPRAH